VKKQNHSAKRAPYGHLSHTSYTGKRLPKQHTSYPILIFLLLCLGVFMYGLSLTAQAANVSVTATADGPPPPGPAVITSPSENDRFSAVPITVKGTCPARFLVKLNRNNVFSGAALCATDNTFQIETDLFEGPNDLQARIFNAVDEEGPTSPAIRVYYDKPPAPVTPSSPTPISNPVSEPSPPSKALPPLIIKADNLLKGYYIGDEINWPLDITGGNAPYALSIDWGDGNSSIFSRKQSGEFSIHHIYSMPGPKQDSYVIKLVATDVDGNKTYLQLMVIVHDKSNVAVATLGSTNKDGLSSLRIFWPVYSVTLLMAVSFWLGQRREYLRLKPNLRTHKQH
jgi:hypothetical protein